MGEAAELEYENKKRKTRRERFLERMEVLIPWSTLLAEIKPYYPCGDKDRVPYSLESMVRVHCVQLFYSLSDAAMEDMLYEVERVRRFCSISLETVPDGSKILNIRQRLERHGLGRKVFERISEDMAKQGLLLKSSILDATIIEAPASRKNRKGERDGEIKPKKKGKQWHFGMRLHIRCR